MSTMSSIFKSIINSQDSKMNLKVILMLKIVLVMINDETTFVITTTYSDVKLVSN